MGTKRKLMITCKEATFLISKQQQDTLSWADKMRLNFHLMMCKYCRRFLNQVEFMSKAIGRMKEMVEKRGVDLKLSDEQKQRLRNKMDEALK